MASKVRLSAVLMKIGYLLLALCLQPTNTAHLKRKIVIIGAGPAGIAAATKLLEYGFEDVTILEAESRFGGRIHTIPFGDNVVDLGAHWCHGEEGNVVYELAKDRNLLESSGDMEKNIKLCRSNGEVVEETMTARLLKIMNEIKDSRYAVAPTYNGSAMDYIKSNYLETLKKFEYKDINKVLAAEYFENFQKDQCAGEACDRFDEIMLLGEEEYEECAGDQALNWKDKGYKELLRLLMKSHELGRDEGILEGHIRLSKEVEKIQWQRDDKKVLLICHDGEEILADHVIVTVSLGVLKAMHTKLFEPQLSAKKQKAIEGINFGTVNKIYLEFEQKFWPDNLTGVLLLWREEELKEIAGTDKAWMKDVYGIYKADYQPRLLECWIVGENARFMETLNASDIKNAAMDLLHKFLPWNATVPINFISTTWYTNPHFRGSYSYHSLNTKKMGVSPRHLEKALVTQKANCEEENENELSVKKCEVPVVLFAGEATNTKHFSTVHGAVETGWREAKRLGEFYGIKDL